MKKNLAQRVATIEAEGRTPYEPQEKTKDSGKDIVWISILIIVGVVIYVTINLLLTL